MSNDLACIQGSLVDVRNVGTHKSVKLTIHVPEEQAMLVMKAFGWPTGVNPVAVAVAALDEQGGEARGDHAGDMAVRTHESVTRASGPPIKERRAFDTLPIATQAVLWCKEPRFWKLLQRDYPVTWERFLVKGDPPGSPDVFAMEQEGTAACVVRDICKVNSRGSIHADNTAWRELVSSYQAWKLL